MAGESEAGTLYTWAAIDPRLDQAINQVATPWGLLGGATEGN